MQDVNNRRNYFEGRGLSNIGMIIFFCKPKISLKKIKSINFFKKEVNKSEVNKYGHNPSMERFYDGTDVICFLSICT